MAYSNLNFGQFLHKVDNVNIKNNIRSYEKLKKRIVSAKYAILFNQICSDAGLYRIFTNMYIYIYIQLLRIKPSQKLKSCDPSFYSSNVHATPQICSIKAKKITRPPVNCRRPQKVVETIV